MRSGSADSPLSAELSKILSRQACMLTSLRTVASRGPQEPLWENFTKKALSSLANVAP